MVRSWRQYADHVQLSYITSANDASSVAGDLDMEQVSHSEPEKLRLLLNQLDALWLQYLDLLDQYTNAQAAIKEHMSSGFLSLAQANYKSTRGRYGQDYYDARSVASTRVAINTKNDGLCVEICKIAAKADQHTPEQAKESEGENPTDASISEVVDVPSEVESAAAQLPTPAASPEPESKPAAANVQRPASVSEKSDGDASPTNADPAQDGAPTPQIDVRDPIRWFGILVPPTLRQAQAAFIRAVLEDDAMSKAIRASRGLKEAEMEIRKLRKAIKKAEKMVESKDEVIHAEGAEHIHSEGA